MINQPSLLMPEARHILQLIHNLGNGILWWPFHRPSYIEPNEELVYSWPTSKQIYYTRQPQNFSRSTPPRPVLLLDDIHVTNVFDIEWGEAARLGPPSTEIRTSQAVTLYPGDSTSLKISSGFSETHSRSESVRVAVQESLQLSFGATPVGAQFTSQLTAELSKSSSESETSTEGVEQSITVTNNKDFPFIVHLEATRTVERERCSAVANVDFDYAIRLAPFQRAKENIWYVWGNKAEFISSLNGLENDSVGAAIGRESISSVARNQPQTNIEFSKLDHSICFSFEYDRVVDLKVRQVRTDLNGNVIREV